MALSPDDIVDLAEQLRDLGVVEFSTGDVYVKFREGTVVPAEATRGGQSPGEHPPTGRDLRSQAEKQGIGPPSWPGSDK